MEATQVLYRLGLEFITHRSQLHRGLPLELSNQLLISGISTNRFILQQLRVELTALKQYKNQLPLSLNKELPETTEELQTQLIHSL